jgi:glycosyltransferase involved in cell wall biosynthesis
MRVSLAMCTYNGSQFLREQLNSIASQTRLPDELVICDDGSTDATLAMIRECIGAVKFPIRVQCNPRRIGAAKNFEQAVSLSNGDIIVLCDQDDIWRQDKLEILEQVLSENPHAGYVFSDASIIDEMGKVIRHSLWEEVCFDSTKRAIFSRGSMDQVRILLRGNVVTGATMAFRGSLKRTVLPILESWMHDEWISFVSSINGAYGILIHEPLIYYRQHQAQAIGIHPQHLGVYRLFKRAWRSLLGNSQAYTSCELVLNKWSAPYALFKSAAGQPPIGFPLLEEHVAHFVLRTNLCRCPRINRLATVAAELTRGRYHLYSGGWKSAIKDLLFPVTSRSYAV